MKKLATKIGIVLILVTTLPSCLSQSPKFAAGDCITNTSTLQRERWELSKPSDILKILEVGREKYRLTFIPDNAPDTLRQASLYFSILDDTKIKVECSKNLKGVH